MLMDDVMAARGGRLDGMTLGATTKLAGRLAVAKRHRLGGVAARSAYDASLGRIDGIVEKLASLCPERGPVWVEWDPTGFPFHPEIGFRDQALATESPIDAVGVLYERDGGVGRRFHATVAWTHRVPRAERPEGFILSISPAGLYYAPDGTLPEGMSTVPVAGPLMTRHPFGAMLGTFAHLVIAPCMLDAMVALISTAGREEASMALSEGFRDVSYETTQGLFALEATLSGGWTEQTPPGGGPRGVTP